MPWSLRRKGSIMMLKKWSKILGVVSAVACVPAALAAEPIKLNCPTGTRQASSANGKAADIVACMKTEGKGFSPHGPTVYLYSSGAKQAEGMSEDGFRTGLWTFFDEQGKKTGSAAFKRSNFHGEVVELYANGTVKKVEQYVEGLRQGTAKEFSADGKLVKKTEYRDNRAVASK
jgi:antitoxin component YwqK of YwqJK toxin-antitoxin module